VSFERLSARDAVLVLPRGPLQVSDGFIGASMLVTTPDMRLLMDNRSPAMQAGYDVQLFAPDKRFWLYVDGKFVQTRLAHVIYRGEAVNPDLSEGLEGAESSVREIAREELAKLGLTVVLPSPGDLLMLPARGLVDIGTAAPLNLEQ
jgi:hypothetical protein